MSYAQLDDLDDVLIVQKIDIKDPATVASSNDLIKATQCLCFESGCDCERDLFAEEQEAIIKKQLQMLQADERGKQAFISEIAALKERQETKAELLRRRQHALDIEKERSRKIASLPPPLPKSVKLLLNKADDTPKLSKPDVQMPDELTAFNIKPIEICYKNTENKENKIIDPEELEARRKMHEEWGMKAKKRYYEALKKDRQKEEYSKIMKQIQNAELLNRQEMAKNVSSDKKGMPCPLSDKFQTAKKQVDMEDAAEKIFKRTGTKEHVIEDIEGYQDHYEEKYKKIHSNHEAKLIDCVPSFVKENYDYLLGDESRFTVGKNYSESDDSNSDIFNQAYIETPPRTDEFNGTGEIDHAISHLDKLRSNLEVEYEQNVKPLLAATEIPKKELKDQAVETDSVKVLAEDKAVETDEQLKNELSSPTPTTTFNFKNAGVMAFKRRPRLPILSTYEEMHLPDMHQRDVRYAVPLISESSDPIESWSPSTYCSLPSKHGIPLFSNGSKSTVCDICIAEMKKSEIKDNFVCESSPVSTVFNKENNDKLSISSEKAPLSEYVQQLVKKHLVIKSTKNCMQSENNVKSFSDSCFPNNSSTSPKTSAFEKEVIGKSKAGIFGLPDSSKEFNSVPIKKILPEEEERKFQFSPFYADKPISITKTEADVKMSETGKEMIKNEELQDDIYSKIKDNEPHESPIEYTAYDYEAKRIQAIYQVLSHKLPRFALDDEDNKNNREAEQSTFPVQNEKVLRSHIYHELSTIQEVDSALTASSLQLSQSKFSDTSEWRRESEAPVKEKVKDLAQSTEKLKMISLLDPPDTEISELAKNIHFVPETEKNIDHSLENPETAFTNSSSDQSIYSKEYLSTPTLATGSYSAVSTPEFTPSLPMSNSMQSIPSAESRENKDILNCIMSGYISDSETQDMAQSKSLHPIQDKKDAVSTIISGYISDLDVPQVSTANMSSPDPEKNEMHSIISGYISDLEMPHASTSDTHLGQNKKDIMHSIISGHISDLDLQQKPNSDISDFGQENNIHPAITEIPGMTKTDVSHFYIENKDNMHSIKSGYIRNVNIPHKNDSLNVVPITPCSDVSSPNMYKDKIHTTLKSWDTQKIPIDTGFSLKQNQFLLQTPSSKRSFKLMTPYSNISSPSESSINNNAFQNDHKGGSSKLMTLHSSVSPSIEIVDHAFKGYHKEDDSTRNFKPMTPYSNVSSPTDFLSHTSEKNLQSVHKDGKFNPMSSHSDASPSIEIVDHSLKEHHKDDDSTGNFKPMTPHSNVSSPIDFVSQTSENNLQSVHKDGIFKPMSSHSNASPSIEIVDHAFKGYHKDDDSTGNFKPMTPHSNVSSPSDFVSQTSENNLQSVHKDGNVKPMSSHSNASSSIEIIDHALKGYHKDDDSVGNFKPMTPHSNVSSPSDLASHTLKKDIQDEKNVGVLKPMPLYSNISSSRKLVNFAFEKDLQYSQSSRDFQALTPYSNISSPREVVLSINEERKSYASSFGNYKALTPHTNISSPSSDVFVPYENVPIGDASSSRKEKDNIYSKNTEIKPVIYRFDSLTLNSTENKHPEANHISQINCSLTLKTHLSTGYNQTPQLPCEDNRKYVGRSKNKVQKRHKGFNLITAKQCALACSSDFFIPSMNEDLAFINENINKALTDLSTPNKPEAILRSQMVSLENIKKNTEHFEKLEEKKSGSESASSNKIVEEPLVVKITEPCKTQVQLGNDGNSRKQCSNLQGLSSTSSSSENLSVISRSKVVFQSTPIKNISEILQQEPCILDEPDLTLVPNELSCKMDKTEINKGPLTSIPSQVSAHLKNAGIAGSSQDECITPTSVSPQFLDSVDTPSMLSFLQHEMNCRQTEISIQSPADGIPIQQKFQENKTPVLREVKGSLFQKDAYKARTKRLWNNLEEVKKKNSEEERKKIMEINRKKAREYAKNLTPKQRRK